MAAGMPDRDPADMPMGSLSNLREAAEGGGEEKYMADTIKADETVDITDVVCPVTFVKAKVALEELDDGQILSIHMNDGEPVQNVPRSIKDEGHKILKLTDNEDGTYDLLVRKVGD